MALTDASDPRVDARRRRTVAWVVGLATLGMIFDGYDLVVYGAVCLLRPRISRDGRRAARRYRQRHHRTSEGDARRLRVVRDRNSRNRVDERCVDVWTAAVSDT